MLLMREVYGWSLPTIGKVTGDRDHTTALFALKKMTARLDRSPAYREKRDELVAALRAEGGR
jgi:chromosomal replication initiation ATPase DnaA